MKREIKFRVWDEKVGLYYSDGSDYIGLELKPKNYQKYYKLAIIFNSIIVHEIFNNCVVQQFTGLQDKNGKDIYEGDILKCHKNIRSNDKSITNPIGAVEWNKKRCCFELKGVSSNHFGVALLTSVNRKEVIGNIFENPELL